MFDKTEKKENRIVVFYKRFIQPDIQKNRYRRITKLFASVAKFLLFKKPPVLVVETGTVCNLDCPTCPTPRDIIIGARTAKNMDLDSFKKIINNAHRSFSAVLLYWTNEPFLNKDIVKMVRYCNELNLYTFISTNVMLLTEEKFRELIDAELDEILVCLDGFSPETFEPFRKGAKFEIVKKNIETICRVKRELKSLTPWIEIQYVETKQNSKELASCKEWARETGVDGFRVEQIYVVDYLKDGKELRNEFYTEKMWEDRSDKNIQAGRKICKVPNSQVCVLINGQLTICCHDIKGVCSFGNLLEESFESIVSNKKYSGLKRRGKRRELGICKNC